MVISGFIFIVFLPLVVCDWSEFECDTGQVVDSGQAKIVKVISCTFDHLRDDDFGGEVYMENTESRIAMTRCSLLSCSTKTDSDCAGGALCLHCAEASIARCSASGCFSYSGQFADLESATALNEWVFYQSSCLPCASTGVFAWVGTCYIRSSTRLTASHLNFTQ
jgi:hypothetical protein